MRRLVALLAVGVAALGGAVAIAQGNGRAAAPVGVHLTTLSHATFGSSVHADGAGVDFRTRGPKQALVTSITVDRGGTFGWHSHPGPVLVTVAKGTLAEFHAEGSRRWLAAVRSGLFSTCSSTSRRRAALGRAARLGRWRRFRLRQGRAAPVSLRIRRTSFLIGA